jgi:hypothetical protein
MYSDGIIPVVFNRAWMSKTDVYQCVVAQTWLRPHRSMVVCLGT